LISSELPEVVGLADRVAVMRSGRITGMLEGDRIDEHEIVQYATGLKSDGGNHADAA
jgi:ribose transport system ATP-binding protein